MTFYQLAIRYLGRKKSKTILLLLVLLFVNSMILSINIVLRATEDSKAVIQEKTKSQIVLDILNKNDKITTNDVKRIENLAEVASVNRLSSNTAYLSDFNPITNSNSTKEENLTVTLHSYDNLQNDSAFFEGSYRLTAGTYFTTDAAGGIVINSGLADYNGLKIGDKIAFETAIGKTVSVKIVGLFLSGSEGKQTDSIAAVNRIENQIFIDNIHYADLFGKDGFQKVSVYTKKPNQLEKLESELKDILGEKVEMTTSDTLYKQMEVSLEQITRVTKLMLVLTFITGTVVVSLMLCMWMRTRQKETAIFISIGKSKSSIFLQIVLESLIVFIFSTGGACGIGSFTAEMLQSIVTDTESSGLVLAVCLQLEDIVALLCIGGSVVVIADVCSLILLLKAKPKDTLSKMEG